MKLLTIGISASTHQIGLLEELWISIRPLIERVSVILDLLEVPGITSRDYLERLARVTCGSKIRIRTRKSGSLGASRNYVLKNAETPYVMFLDGDDFLDASNLAYVLDVLSVPGPAVDIGVFAGRLYERGHSASWLTNLLPSHPLKSVDQWMSWFEAMGWRMTSACVKIYAVDWLAAKNITFVEELFYEDTPLWFDIACAIDGKTRLEFFNVEIYNYRRWGSQITETRDARLFHFFWIIDLIQERLQAAQARSELWVAFYAFVLDHLVWSSARMSESDRPLAEKRLFQTLVDRYAREAKACLSRSSKYHLPQHLENHLIRKKPGYVEPELKISAAWHRGKQVVRSALRRL